MIGYYIKRVAQAVITLLTVITFGFVLFRLMPGGPMDYLRAQFAGSATDAGDSGVGQEHGGSTDASAEEFASFAEAYTGINPDKPIYISYLEYIQGFLVGDFGQSIWYSRPVADIVANTLPWTLFILTGSSILMFLIGIMLGAVMAYYEGSKLDSGLTVFSLVQSSIPYYIAGVALLMLFAYNIDLFPRGGRFNPDTTPGLNYPFLASAVWHAVLPTLSLVVTGLGGSLAMRGNSISVLGQDYMRVARLRGLPDHRIAFRYVMRNAVLPLYTGFMISLGTLVSGSVILERIFNYPGIGYYTVEAFVARDYPLLMGLFILSTVVVILGILIADLTYGLLDPRIDVSDREAY